MAISGTAMLIPPSTLAALFFVYVGVRATLRPQDVPSDEVKKQSRCERWMPFLVYVLPLSGILIVVVGSLLVGYASPTKLRS